MPDFSLEQPYSPNVAGIDEAGRGPWAGPVVAACVMLHPDNIPDGINDSKKLSETKRNNLFEQIMAHHHVGIGQASVEDIDRYNILNATKLAMQRAYHAMAQPTIMALIDGNQTIDLPCQVQAVIQGDSKSLSIAAASIIAKVTRDRIMASLAQEFPYFGWEKNKGYGTKAHQQGLEEFGVTSHHRKSFAPIKKILAIA